MNETTTTAIKVYYSDLACLNRQLHEGGYAAFQQSARALWESRGHAAAPGATFEAQRHADCDNWYLLMRTAA